MVALSNRSIALSLCFCLSFSFLVGCDSDDHDPVSSESTPPAILSVTPSPDSQDVSTKTLVEIVFSEPVDPSSVVVLIDGLIRGTVTLVDSVATVTLDKPLLPYAEYEAAVLAGVEDLAGNSMDTAYVWHFRTGFGPVADTWKIQPAPTANRLNAIVRGSHDFFAVGEDGLMFTSTDGSQWSTVPFQAGAAELWAAFPIGERYAVVGSPGTLVSSGDPISWMQDTLADSIHDLYDLWVAFDGIYMVGTGGQSGSNGILVKYASPSNWSVIDLGTQLTPRGIAHNSSSWAIVGDSGLVTVSNDGINYNLRDFTKGTGNFYSVHWVAPVGRFIAAGEAIMTSPTSASWFLRRYPSTRAVHDLAWISLFDGTETHTLICAVGDSGLIMTSSDGITWTEHESGTTADLYGIARGPAPTQFVVVGESGTVLISE